MQPQRRAYLCFSYVSLCFIALTLLRLLPLELSNLQVIGMIIGIPATLLFVLASLIGMMTTSIFCREEWPLLTMSITLFGLYLLFFINRQQLFSADSGLENTQNIALLGMALIISLSGHWFFSKRSLKSSQPQS